MRLDPQTTKEVIEVEKIRNYLVQIGEQYIIVDIDLKIYDFNDTVKIISITVDDEGNFTLQDDDDEDYEMSNLSRFDIKKIKKFFQIIL